MGSDLPDNIYNDDDISHKSNEKTVRVDSAFAYQRRLPIIKLKLLAYVTFKGLMSRGSNISTLSLSNCALTSFGAHMLSIILTETNVTEVHYSDNDISQQGAYELAQALTNNKILRELILQNTNLSDNS